MKKKIVIIVKNGMVQEIYGTKNIDDIEITVLDLDTDDTATEHIVESRYNALKSSNDFTSLYLT